MVTLVTAGLLAVGLEGCPADAWYPAVGAVEERLGVLLAVYP